MPHDRDMVGVQTLEKLWTKAESLGSVTVRRPLASGARSFTGCRYEVSIAYERHSGTRIEAIGRDNSFRVALVKAIAEADALKSF